MRGHTHLGKLLAFHASMSGPMRPYWSSHQHCWSVIVAIIVATEGQTSRTSASATAHVRKALSSPRHTSGSILPIDENPNSTLTGLSSGLACPWPSGAL